MVRRTHRRACAAVMAGLWVFSVFFCSLLQTAHCTPSAAEPQTAGGHEHSGVVGDHHHDAPPNSSPNSTPCDDEPLCTSLGATWYQAPKFTFFHSSVVLYVQPATIGFEQIAPFTDRCKRPIPISTSLGTHEVCTALAIYANAPPLALAASHSA